MANPYGRFGRAPAWFMVAVVLWLRGLGVRLGFSVHGPAGVVLCGAGAQRARPTLPLEGRLDLTVFPRKWRAE